MNQSRIREIINKMREVKVLVVGDIMLDRYLKGRVERISPEAEVPVLDHDTTTTNLGGAANVALNFKALEVEVALLSITGDDETALEVEMLLNAAKIKHQLTKDSRRPTTVKTRVMEGDAHLLRVDFESTKSISPEVEETVFQGFLNLIKQMDPEIVVLQDYNKGLLTPTLISKILNHCVKHNIFVGVDPKIENFWSYEGVGLFKPNLKESTIALGRSLKSLAAWKDAAIDLQSRLGAKYIAITLSENGIIVRNQNEDFHLPVQPIKIVDVCGAGDAVMVVLALMTYLQIPIEEVSEVANLVGSQVCAVPGVASIDAEALIRVIDY